MYVLTYYFACLMEQSLSWQANSFLASQEIPHVLWKPRKFITALLS